MGYSGHTVNRPRSILVIIGGILAWVGLVGGVLVATPQYHYALTMKEEPVEMTWQELVDNGLTDNSHVRLTNVALEEKGPPGFFEEMMELDPDAPMDEQAVQDFVQEVDFSQVFEAAMQPVKVYPKGEDPDAYADKVVVPIASWATEAAIKEIEATGTLTGRFALSDGTGFATQLVEEFLASAAAAQADAMNAAPLADTQGVALADETKQTTPPAIAESGSEADTPTSTAGQVDAETTQAAAANGETPPLSPEQASPIGADEVAQRYVFEPVGMIPSRSESQQWFWLSGLAVAIGLVICGAGGPSIVCCIFFQTPSVLSIFGYPMRYGRAGRTTRIVYLVAGLALIGYGYDTIVVHAKFGQLDGDVLRAALGFIPTFFGAGAVLGVGVNVMMERLNLSLEPATKKKEVEPKISMTEACSLEPCEAEPTFGFEDRHLIPSSDPLPEILEQVADSLGAVGFEHPEVMACQDGLELKSVLIQLGCQDMVVADVEIADGSLCTRLVSVLQDGISIISLSPHVAVEKETRLGSCGMYISSPSNTPIDMLSTHLEQTIAMAEKRNTTIVTIDPAESVDVTLFSRRVLADIRRQYGEENVDVAPASYGRFHLPPQPIPSLEAV